jgi:hypothetical protein
VLCCGGRQGVYHCQVACKALTGILQITKLAPVTFGECVLDANQGISWPG